MADSCMPELKSHSWTNCFTSQCLSFFNCKIRIIMIPPTVVMRIQ